jgi:hypothetical protein
MTDPDLYKPHVEEIFELTEKSILERSEMTPEERRLTAERIEYIANHILPSVVMHLLIDPYINLVERLESLRTD